MASSYAMSCRGSTAMSAVRGPLEGIMRGSWSMPRASLGLSVMTNTGERKGRGGRGCISG